ncbi:FAD:protein FMN transferase [Permianibacter sp. IMCC34836]|uniref:FAD:protein FMN transferase n=1 Tax=Permianibacter fluminis TaxID=2738515 RepID=UPI0015576A04|nr:FAD:protein FMN transferase [Permianibacter fluminis]NQD36763.1 FAD:protein FMN transferase [Permianibacter fluminis]
MRPPATASTLQLELQSSRQLGSARFNAMASPCEILLDSSDQHLLSHCGQLAEQEALRIEQRFSRYRNDNLIYQINNANGEPVTVDDELANLLDYAQTLYELSDGLFDISSGVLRKLWRFDGSGTRPDQAAVTALLDKVGWQKVRWQRPQLQLRAGMEIDLGGIGKEYAVDRVFDLLAGHTHVALLVNFGGDLRARGPRANGEPWHVGLEQPDKLQQALTDLPLQTGALTTSGDARRSFVENGVRYGHILNPKTGYPVRNAPRSVTVLADTCIEAGALSTLAMLHGAEAESFLSEQDVRSWCVR